jgi:hypothetical protein
MSPTTAWVFVAVGLALALAALGLLFPTGE